MKQMMFAAVLGGTVMALAAPAAAQPSPEQAKAAFDKVDTDHDGVLSADEWKAAGRRDRGFAMADTDKDGKVTPAELQALAAKYGR